MTTEWDIHDQIESAWLDGEEAGITKGEARGRELGRAEGEARGEAKEKAKIAKALKENDVPIEKIAQASGLTVEEISRL